MGQWFTAVSTSHMQMDHMKDDLHNTLELTDIGEPSKIVSIEINQTDNKLSISQKKYTEKILANAGMLYPNSISTPLDINKPIIPNPEGSEGNRSNSFASVLWELQVLTNATHPDIACAVNKLA